MKLLIIAGYYPPNCPLAATRAPRLARYFEAHGHDVRVIAPARTEYPEVLKSEIAAEKVIYTPINDIAGWPGKTIGGLLRRKGAEPDKNDVGDGGSPADTTAGSRPDLKSRLKNSLGAIYRRFALIPDASIGWLHHAVSAGKVLMKTWQPDLIYSTTPPHTGHLVASRLSKASGVPWVAEFRDLWTGHPYYDEAGLRRAVDRWLERRTLQSASAMVTVTEGWRQELAAKWKVPVALVTNGFEPAEFTDAPHAPSTEGPLSILYAGGIYPGKRDPEALFAAIASLTDSAEVKVDFYGTESQSVDILARRHGVEHCVKVHPPIPREDIIALEKDADILLLLRWDDPGENAVLAGKLFEYIGARRPILSVGGTKGEAVDLICDHGIGVVASDATTIEAALRDWIVEKRRGGVAAPAIADIYSFTRPHQFTALEKFLKEIIS